MFTRRLLHLLGVVVGASAVAFLMGSLLPGDPAVVILGGHGTAAQIASLRHQLGLDKPLPDRYANWIWDALHGDFGQSYITHESIGSALADRLPVSLELMALAQLIALTVAVPLALLSVHDSLRRKLGRLLNGGAMAVLSIPTFVIALLGIYLIAVKTQVVPALGYVSFRRDPGTNLRDFVLPALTLCAHPGVIYFRVLRAELTEALGQEYVLMARSQGLHGRTVLLRHAFPPALPALLTVVGIHTGTMIGGAVVVESIFGLPGIGSLIVAAATQNDYIVLQSCVLVIAVGFVVINFLVDLAQLALDPRVRFARV